MAKCKSTCDIKSRVYHNQTAAPTLRGKTAAVYAILKRRGSKGLTQIDLNSMYASGKITNAQYTTRLGAVVFELKNTHGLRVEVVRELNKTMCQRYARYFVTEAV